MPLVYVIEINSFAQFSMYSSYAVPFLYYVLASWLQSFMVWSGISSPEIVIVVVCAINIFLINRALIGSDISTEIYNQQKMGKRTIILKLLKYDGMFKRVQNVRFGRTGFVRLIITFSLFTRYVYDL